jgi:hypothetical protein
VSTTILCPFCGSPYDSASGPQDRCPVCGREKATGITSEPAPVQESAQQVAAAQQAAAANGTALAGTLADPRRSPALWASFRTGLTLMVVSLVVDLALVPVSFIFQMAGDGPHMLTLRVGQIVDWLIALAACVLCCMIPRAARVSGWVLTVVFALIAGLVLGGVAVVLFLPALETFTSRGNIPDAVGLPLLAVMGLVILVALVGSIGYFMVLRGAAIFWNDRELGGRFVLWLVLFCLGLLVIVVTTVIFMIPILSSQPGTDQQEAKANLDLFSGCSLLLFRVAMWVWLLLMVSALRSYIPTRQQPEAAAP